MNIENQRMQRIILLAACVSIGLHTLVCGGPPRRVDDEVDRRVQPTNADADRPLQNSGNCLKRLPAPSHGKVKGQWEFNISVHIYECEEHFILQGDTRVFCLFGVWEGQPPVCVDSRCYTKDLNHRTGLAVQDIEAIPSGDQLFIKCINGYHASNKAPFCQKGKWIENGEYPCIEDRCDVPQGIDGAITKSKRIEEIYDLYKEEYQTITHYTKEKALFILPGRSQYFVSCNDGYSFEGNGKNHVPIVCERGKWKPNPICLKTIGCTLNSLFLLLPPDIAPDMEIMNDNIIAPGSILNLTCKGNTKLIGNNEVTCEENSEWLVDRVECLSFCSAIKIPPSSPLIITPQKDFYMQGDRIHFQCPPGMFLRGVSFSITCFYDSWSDVGIPECWTPEKQYS